VAKKAAKAGSKTRKGPTSAARKPAADRPVTLRLTASEFQLVSYAASKTRARGVGAWMREAVVEAARHSAGKAMSEDILSGQGTVRLLKESLAEARSAAKRR
jgi:uncharacterized protein (DUF1778 family)